MLIAFAVLITTIVAAISVVFGNQSISADSQTNDEALYLAQQQLEDARALKANSSYDFIATSIPASVSFPYTKQLIVPDPPISDCLKQVISQVRWPMGNRQLKVETSTLLSNPQKVIDLGFDCNTVPPGPEDWKKPQDNLSTSDKIPGEGISIDADNKVVFLGSTISDAKNSEDFFVIDSADNQRVALKTGPLCKRLTGSDPDCGINALSTIKNDDSYYTFVAYSSKSQQLQVIKTTTDFVNSSVVAKATLYLVDRAGSYPQGVSIFYLKNRIYIATKETGGPEFHVFNVSNPEDPKEIAYKEINHNVNSIYVKEQNIGGVIKPIAYLALSATSDSAPELSVLDADAPDNPGVPVELPDPISSFNAAGKNQYGTSVYGLGNKLFLGRERGTSNPDLYVLDIKAPTVSPLPLLGSKVLGLNPNKKVSAIRATGNLVFLGTTDSNNPFSVWSIANLPAISLWNVCNVNFSAEVNGIDFDGGWIYAVVGQNGPFYIIKPTGATCPG